MPQVTQEMLDAGANAYWKVDRLNLSDKLRSIFIAMNGAKAKNGAAKEQAARAMLAALQAIVADYAGDIDITRLTHARAAIAAAEAAGIGEK